MELQVWGQREVLCYRLKMEAQQPRMVYDYDILMAGVVAFGLVRERQRWPLKVCKLRM